MQVKGSSSVQNNDTFLIQSMAVTAAASMEEIKDMFDKASSPIEECERRVLVSSDEENKSADQQFESILRGFIICSLILVFGYILKQTLTWIWSLAVVVTMLIINMTIKFINKLVSDSVEDLIVKTLFSIIMYAWAHASPMILHRWTSRFMTASMSNEK
ncbi:uncharacterized protein LOC127243626 [Andrographis paniculata]|uniref:uncharacterized protein LOC127243626 n=1 Tax=Andrographis paniculata TaxID=175694 RepID=UPI0021E91C19|nr:uncharacterized protein LOC127243626 [Andrographis paniculata]